MRLRCHLREIRERQELALRDVAETAGVNRGSLSAIERGRALPADGVVPALETAYGAPAHEWYPPEVLLVIEHPEGGRAPAGAKLLPRMEPA